ncbi:hypothetical protein Btru_076408 [Bulinus truncatus]|nr:hypothetical protein Btru_076408 [Bulinus truncatus]
MSYHMIIKMANSEDNGLNREDVPSNSIDELSQSTHVVNADETLITLLASTLLENEADDVSELDELAGEYSSLNNAIDEINNYLDRWEARHDHLRAEIFEVLKENKQEEKHRNENRETACDGTNQATNTSIDSESEKIG